MKIIITYCIVILCAASLFAQTQKYFIYFKDKDFEKSFSLNKISSPVEFASSILSERSVERRKKVMGDNILTYEDLPIKQSYIEELEAAGIKIKNRLNWFNAVTAELTFDNINFLRSKNFVEKIEPVKKLIFKERSESDKRVSKILSDQPYAASAFDYGLSFTQLNTSEIPAVQSAGIKGENVLIGVLDSGFKWKTHPALINADIVGEYDFVFQDTITANQTGDAANQHEHGTYVLSVIAGFDEGNLIGASFGSQFVLAKTENVGSELHVEEDNYAAALEWMDRLGVDIATSSVGYNIFDSGTYSYRYSDMNGNTTIVARASNMAFDRGMVTVTSAGNEGNNSWFYVTTPADAFNIIAVGSVDKLGQPATYSSRGPTSDGRIKPEVVTQGISVFGADAFSDGYKFSGGTSSAAPIAAGVAGLLLSANPHLNNKQVRHIFLESGSNASSPDNVIGYGILSAKRALEFPNIETTDNGKFIIHKMIIEKNNIAPSSMKIFVKRNSDQFRTFDLAAIDSLRFNFELPSIFVPGDTLAFSYSYLDSTGTTIRIPEQNNFKMILDQSFVVLNTNLDQSITGSPTEYILNNPYPNPFPIPFNSSARIVFVSPKSVNASMKIYNILGEQVRDLFSGVASVGENIVFWDGRNDYGETASSGVYIYTLNIGGQILSNKLIVLK